MSHPFIELGGTIMKSKKAEKERKGKRALYFPMHSTNTLKAPMHSEGDNIARLLKKEKDQGNTINLCIYYIDYLKLKEAGQWQEYKERFESVYCCGHRLDPAFLVNLAILLNEHDYIISDGVSSHTFFAAMMNKTSKVADQNANSYGFENMHIKRVDAEARKIDINAHKNVHRLIENQGSSLEIAKRYFINKLNPEEEQICSKFLQTKMPESHYAFSNEYSSRIYPLVN